MSDDIRKRMWTAMAASPFVMVKLDGPHGHAEPMTAQLDKDAHGAFWFYTGRDNRIAPGGPAMVQFTSRGHDLFACISGRLVEETDPAIIDRHWSNTVEAWYPGGRNDPNLLMMRLDLDEAEIWAMDMNIKGLFKLLTGKTVRPGEVADHAVVDL